MPHVWVFSSSGKDENHQTAQTAELFTLMKAFVGPVISFVWLVLWHINHCRLFNTKFCVYILNTGDIPGAMVIVVANRHSDPSSNPVQDSLHLT